jgi:uncharacterized protein (DUF736 family)
MIIGNLKKGDDNSFQGSIHTLTLHRDIAIEPVAAKKSDKAPDYRITLDNLEIGAGWKEKKEGGNAYLSIRLDDPALPAPINCILVKTGSEVGYTLIWDRNRKKAHSNSSEF